MKQVRLNFCHRSDTGLVRPTNQDSYAVELLDPPGDAALLLIADGMGGYEGGEVASRLAVETVRQRVLTAAPDWAKAGDLTGGLVEAIQEANRSILEAQRQRPDLSRMGTTLTAALIWGERIIIGHVGDSRACLIRPGGSAKVTFDHNVAGELVRSGHLTDEQAAVHPQRNVLTRALGVAEELAVDQLELTWQPGDVLVLCTDGLTNLVSLPELEAQVRGDFATLTDRLVDLANARGGHDNITVLAARWEG